jgi:ribulose-phosphate 3-epimerase
MLIIPVINEKEFAEIQRKIKLIEPYSSWVQIDVEDGIFTSTQTWNNSADLLRLDSSINIEVHLMVKNPELVLESWLRVPMVKRALVHLEATAAMEKIINLGEEFEKEIGIVINPETPVANLEPYLNEVNFFQMLAVKPGLAGQEFQPEVINKIKALKAHKNDVIIEVDGGVTPKNAKLLKEAGADILNSATYIFNSLNIQEAMAALNG